ncbi:hypothetical protein RFI_18624, partial [Reticulomyxa filosa]
YDTVDGGCGHGHSWERVVVRQWQWTQPAHVHSHLQRKDRVGRGWECIKSIELTDPCADKDEQLLQGYGRVCPGLESSRSHEEMEGLCTVEDWKQYMNMQLSQDIMDSLGGLVGLVHLGVEDRIAHCSLEKLRQIFEACISRRLHAQLVRRLEEEKATLLRTINTKQTTNLNSNFNSNSSPNPNPNLNFNLNPNPNLNSNSNPTGVHLNRPANNHVDTTSIVSIASSASSSAPESHARSHYGHNDHMSSLLSGQSSIIVTQYPASTSALNKEESRRKNSKSTNTNSNTYSYSYSNPNPTTRASDISASLSPFQHLSETGSLSKSKKNPQVSAQTEMPLSSSRLGKQHSRPPIHLKIDISTIHNPRIRKLTELGFSKAETPAHIVKQSGNDDDALKIPLPDSPDADDLNQSDSGHESDPPVHQRNHTISEDQQLDAHLYECNSINEDHDDNDDNDDQDNDHKHGAKHLKRSATHKRGNQSKRRKKGSTGSVVDMAEIRNQKLGIRTKPDRANGQRCREKGNKSANESSDGTCDVEAVYGEGRVH